MFVFAIIANKGYVMFFVHFDESILHNHYGGSRYAAILLSVSISQTQF